ncbi:HNH endonuclease [Dactylosporangium sp. CA-139114]|uniref:HNH endonuclease n=1 Tax=Dactylosporangium sp. CA-139114 TaxID=3239931 RepID=UPI003D95CCDD
MLTPRDYLALQPADAQAQWRSIEARSVMQAGRQVNFTPVETLLSLAAGLRVNHRRYGGSTSHKAQEPVPTLARLFRRPNSSILAKMANLDGSRTNGARHEIEIAAHLLAQPAELAVKYQIVLQAARNVGIDSAMLPDFLGLEYAAPEIALLGQDELSDIDIEMALHEDVARWAQSRTDLDTRTTERLLLATAPIGQHRFARDVLHNHGYQCAFCGLGVNLADARAQRMLVASHIKPWRDCKTSERLDVRNGVAACPTHDVAFDTGLLTVNGGLRIHIKPHVVDLVQQSVAAKAAFGRPPIADRPSCLRARAHRILSICDGTKRGSTRLRWAPDSRASSNDLGLEASRAQRPTFTPMTVCAWRRSEQRLVTRKSDTDPRPTESRALADRRARTAAMSGNVINNQGAPRRHGRVASMSRRDRHDRS